MGSSPKNVKRSCPAPEESSASGRDPRRRRDRAWGVAPPCHDENGASAELRAWRGYQGLRSGVRPRSAGRGQLRPSTRPSRPRPFAPPRAARSEPPAARCRRHVVDAGVAWTGRGVAVEPLGSWASGRPLAEVAEGISRVQPAVHVSSGIAHVAAALRGWQGRRDGEPAGVCWCRPALADEPAGGACMSVRVRGHGAGGGDRPLASLGLHACAVSSHQLPRQSPSPRTP